MSNKRVMPKSKLATKSKQFLYKSHKSKKTKSSLDKNFFIASIIGILLAATLIIYYIYFDY